MTGPILLETDRLVLRVPGEGDVERQMACLNTPTVMKHLGGPRPRAFIAEKHARARALHAAEGFCFCMLEERESGALVGHAGLKRVDNPLARNPGDMEVGWLIREDRWRRGYAWEAVVAVLDFAFARIDPPAIVALTSFANRGSWRLMEKLGMERRPDLDFTDPNFAPEDNPTILYSITRKQWESRT
ncbi:GNAT family N-acetyltransferase [Pelagerythrobacter marensis]|uniref:GNAT family N-acetyltransferase n=1 Tax=Pelagerythrobacter marensis TaxID=543877 RepID=A0ABZ2D9J3_9SPHN